MAWEVSNWSKCSSQCKWSSSPDWLCVAARLRRLTCRERGLRPQLDLSREGWVSSLLGSMLHSHPRGESSLLFMLPVTMASVERRVSRVGGLNLPSHSCCRVSALSCCFASEPWQPWAKGSGGAWGKRFASSAVRPAPCRPPRRLCLRLRAGRGVFSRPFPPLAQAAEGAAVRHGRSCQAAPRRAAGVSLG